MSLGLNQVLTLLELVSKESAMQPTKIVQNAIGACEHVFRAKSLVDMDDFFVNIPVITGDIPHVQPAVRETYCLWQHAHRILIEIAMHQSCAKSLIGISFDELNAVDGSLYDNMPFPSGSYDSELKSCYHALNQLTPTLCTNLRRSISFDEIDEERLAKGYYKPDLHASLYSLLTECKALTSRHAKKLSGIDRSRLHQELRVLSRLGSETGKTDHTEILAEKLAGNQQQTERSEILSTWLNAVKPAGPTSDQKAFVEYLEKHGPSIAEDIEKAMGKAWANQVDSVRKLMKEVNKKTVQLQCRVIENNTCFSIHWN